MVVRRADAGRRGEPGAEDDPEEDAHGFWRRTSWEEQTKGTKKIPKGNLPKNGTASLDFSYNDRSPTELVLLIRPPRTLRIRFTTFL